MINFLRLLIGVETDCKCYAKEDVRTPFQQDVADSVNVSVRFTIAMALLVADHALICFRAVSGFYPLRFRIFKKYYKLNYIMYLLLVGLCGWWTFDIYGKVCMGQQAPQNFVDQNPRLFLLERGNNIQGWFFCNIIIILCICYLNKDD